MITFAIAAFEIALAMINRASGVPMAGHLRLPFLLWFGNCSTPDA